MERRWQKQNVDKHCNSCKDYRWNNLSPVFSKWVYSLDVQITSRHLYPTSALNFASPLSIELDSWLILHLTDQKTSMKFHPLITIKRIEFWHQILILKCKYLIFDQISALKFDYCSKTNCKIYRKKLHKQKNSNEWKRKEKQPQQQQQQNLKERTIDAVIFANNAWEDWEESFTGKVGNHLQPIYSFHIWCLVEEEDGCVWWWGAGIVAGISVRPYTHSANILQYTCTCFSVNKDIHLKHRIIGHHH